MTLILMVEGALLPLQNTGMLLSSSACQHEYPLDQLGANEQDGRNNGNCGFLNHVRRRTKVQYDLTKMLALICGCGALHYARRN